ncbi:MAG: hypothetical protein K5841_07840 [Fretibacterium sp.]|nr:hypothetical protein [Fretibacterium sp.]
MMSFADFKRFRCLLLAAAFTLLFSRVGECLLAQQSTQKSILEAVENEVKQLKEMIEQQKKMLKHLDAKDVNDLKNKRTALVNSFKKARQILEASDTITHVTANLEWELKKRHPEWQSGLTVDQLKTRIENRNKGWRATMNAYLKSVNLTAKDFDSDDKLRSKLMDLVRNPEGQTQAIQTLGALLDHSNIMLARNENVVQGLLASYLEYERDALDAREQKGKSILEACDGLKKHKPAAKSYALGF